MRKLDDMFHKNSRFSLSVIILIYYVFIPWLHYCANATSDGFIPSNLSKYHSHISFTSPDRLQA